MSAAKREAVSDVVVLDSGSSCVKVGYSGEDTPRSIFPAAIGDPINKLDFAKKLGAAAKEKYIGAQVFTHTADLHVSHPIERGVVVDWDKLETLWEHSFVGELGLNLETDNVAVLAIDTALSAKKQRERMAQIMFEKFKVQGFNVATQNVLSLFASGRTRGLVLECGDGTTSAVPVFEGYALPHAIVKTEVAGQDITRAVQDILMKNGVKAAANNRDIARLVKENVCSFDAGTTKSKADRSFELPDGTEISVTDELRNRPPSLLFDVPKRKADNPSQSVGLTVTGLVVKSLSKCDTDLQKDLYKSILLAGGTTMLKGFPKKVHAELTRSFSREVEFQVIPDVHKGERGYNAQRRLAAWIGGSLFTSLSTYRQIQIGKQEWEESHESVIHRKAL